MEKPKGNSLTIRGIGIAAVVAAGVLTTQCLENTEQEELASDVQHTDSRPQALNPEPVKTRVQRVLAEPKATKQPAAPKQKSSQSPEASIPAALQPLPTKDCVISEPGVMEYLRTLPEGHAHSEAVVSACDKERERDEKERQEKLHISKKFISEIARKLKEAEGLELKQETEISLEISVTNDVPDPSTASSDEEELRLRLSKLLTPRTFVIIEPPEYDKNGDPLMNVRVGTEILSGPYNDEFQSEILDAIDQTLNELD